MNKKLLAIIGGAVALVAIIVACIFMFAGGSDSYRSIKVFEIDGSCKVERGSDTLDAFKNMALSSGDVLTVGDGSFTRLKLDDDKYVYLEAGTKISLTATGTSNDSKTTVFVERGSMLTEVKKKLSATSSYDIVTPNTTMSIRGTKTLTEVLEDISGAIRTSAMVIEGNVKFSTIQKDSKGNPVVANVDLSVGQGLGVSTDAESLLSQSDVKNIVESGKTEDGTTVQETTHEELGTTLDTPEFSAEFLTNIVAVLARSRDEDIEEGFVAESVTEEELNAAIEVLNNVIEGSVELPPAVEQYIMEQSAPFYDTTASAAGDSVPSTSDSVNPTESNPPTDDEGGNFVVDGTNNSIVIGDDTDTDGEDGENEDDTAGDEDDGDADESNSDEEGETEEERLAREEQERLEKEEQERLEKEEQERLEKEEQERLEEEEKERLEKEEQERLEKEEKERLEKEEKERLEKEEQERLEKEEKERLEKEEQEKKEREEREAAEAEERERLEREAAEAAEQERLEREAAEAAEREAAEQAAREQAERDAQQSQSSSQTTVNRISYNDLTAEISYASDSHVAATNLNVRVAFLQNSASSTGSSESDAIPMSSLPTTPEQGSVLPGYPGSPYSAIVVPADTSESMDPDIAGSISSLYCFTGWYANEADAASNDLSKRITTYSSSSPSSLYPGISRVCSVILMNYNEGCGSLTIPATLPDNIVGIDTDEGVGYSYAVVKVLPGTALTLPGAESTANANDHLYISMNPAVGSNTSFYCYTTDFSADVSGHYFTEGRPSVYNETRFYFPSDTITVNENDNFLMLYMQFVSPVEIRVRTNGTAITVRNMGSVPENARTLASLINSSGAAQALPGSVPQSTGTEYITTQKWKITNSTTANYDYLLQTVYYGNSFLIPIFEVSGSSDSYNKELLCSYRTSANGPVTTYNNYSDYDVVMFSPEDVDYLNPCKAAVRDGKYVFTVQSVDWVFINMDYESGISGVENTCFKVSENSPFVIPDTEYEENDLYKFAINPIDLYNNNGQPGGSTPAFGLTEIAGGSGFGKYIYAPDDIVYSWNSKGSTRGGAADDPTACYQASYLGSDYAQYSFVGVQGYRLAGFEIEYYQKGLSTMINKTFLLNERSEYEGLYYNAVPCLTAGTSYAVANKLSLDAVWPDTFDMEYNLNSPAFFTPIFVPAAPVTATLTYTEPNFSSRASKTYLLGDYTLSLNTGTSNYGSVKNFDLSSIAIDYARIGVTNGFVSTGFRSSVGSYQLPTMQDQDPYYELYNNGELASGHSWMISHDSNDHIVLKEILTLLAVEDQAAITHYPFANIEGREEEENNTFIRGLKSVGQGSAPSTFTDYRPAFRKVVPAQGEECKYSCFFTRENNQIRFARVFTSSDSFYVDNYGSYYYGAVTDLMGSDNLGSSHAYLGGYISVYVDGNYTFCGTPTENDYAGTVNGLEVRRTTFSSNEEPSNIYGFLGLDSGHAGMFRFYNYTGVRITNWYEAYAYCAGSWGSFVNGDSPHELFSDCSHYALMPEEDRRFTAVFDYASQTGYPEGYINVCVANVACVINIGINQPGKAVVDYLTADQMNNLWTGVQGG